MYGLKESKIIRCFIFMFFSLFLYDGLVRKKRKKFDFFFLLVVENF